MAIQSRALTYDDLQQLRETSDERMEIVDGVLFVTPAPASPHQRAIRRLNRLLEDVVIDAGAGEYFFAPYDVKLADGSVVQPDIVAVLGSRQSIIGEGGIEGVPDFVVEVVSPSTRVYDHGRKRNLYARHGVPEYWLVDPDAHIVTIYSDPEEGRYRSQQVVSDIAISVSIPGLAVDLAALFAPVSGE